MKKKIVLLILLFLSIFCVTGCTQKNLSIEDATKIIHEESSYKKIKKYIVINYAVDDTSITATSELKIDNKKNIAAGEIKLNLNNKVYNIKIYEQNKNIYLKLENTSEFYKINYSLIDLISQINSEKIPDIHYINIHSEEEKVDYYRYEININDDLNNSLKELGAILFKKEISKIDNFKSLEIRKGIKDNYSYKTEINFTPILEANLVKDTSVIGTASYESTLYDFKEEITIPDITNTIELKYITDIFNGGNENENN